MLNDWELWMMYSVDAEKERDAKNNFLSITPILRNKNVIKNFNRPIADGEIF